MTNREAFNLYMTLETSKQLKCMEALDNNVLVCHSSNYLEYGIRVNVGNRLSWFRFKTVGIPVGTKQDVIKWLDEEASEKTTNFLAELQRELESEDRCKDCHWCDEVLKEYKQA